MLQSLQASNFGVSLGYIFITVVVARLARIILLNVVVSKYYRSLILEFIATFELCACCFEFGVVMESQGFLAYTGIMLVMFNYWGNAFQSATAAPHPQLLEVIERKISLGVALTKIFAQVLGASIVYQFYVKPIWSLGYQTKHLERIRQTECNTHLQVSVMFGIFVEALATFVFMGALRIFANRKHNYLILPLILVSIVYTGLNYTGGYFSPILASTIQFGCSGITWSDHFLVYWIGPIVGSIIYLCLSKLIEASDMDNNNQMKKVQ